MANGVELVGYNDFVNLAVAAIVISVALMLAIPSKEKKVSSSKCASKAEEISKWVESQQLPHSERHASVKDEEDIVDGQSFFHRDSGIESMCLENQYDQELFLIPPCPSFRHKPISFNVNPAPSIADSSFSMEQRKWNNVPEHLWNSIDFRDLSIRKVKEDAKRYYVVYRKNLHA